MPTATGSIGGTGSDDSVLASGSTCGPYIPGVVSSAVPTTTPRAGDPAPDSSSEVAAILPLPEGILVGGSFVRWGDRVREAIALIDPCTGDALAWYPGSTASSVVAMAADGCRIYVVGQFQSWRGEYRSGFAAIDRYTAELDPLDLNSSTGISGLFGSGSSARSIAVASDAVYISGQGTLDGNFGYENLVAYDLGTGDKLPSFVTSIRFSFGSGFAVAVAGGTVYLAFTGGGTHKVLAFDRYTGAAAGGWTAPTFDNEVHALAIDEPGGILYAAGWFGTAAGSSRPRVAAFDLTSGALLGWNPAVPASTVLPIASLSLSGSLLYYGGGSDSTTAGIAGAVMGAVDTSTGALMWSPTVPVSGHDPGNEIQAVAAQGGLAFAGGSLDTIGSTARQRFATFGSCGPSLIGTEARDVAATAGSFAAPGAATGTGISDSLAASGVVPDVATLAATEGHDATSEAGTAVAAATFLGFPSPDNPVSGDPSPLKGGTGCDGVLSGAERHDSAAIAGTSGVAGSMARTESRDVPTAVGHADGTNALAAHPADDSLSAGAAIDSGGGLDGNHTPDNHYPGDSGGYSGGNAFAGSVAATGRPDSAALAGHIPPNNLAGVGRPDAGSLAGSVVTHTALHGTGRPDSATIAARLASRGTLAGSGRDDSATGSTRFDTGGTVTVPREGEGPPPGDTGGLGGDAENVARLFKAEDRDGGGIAAATEGGGTIVIPPIARGGPPPGDTGGLGGCTDPAVVPSATGSGGTTRLGTVGGSCPTCCGTAPNRCLFSCGGCQWPNADLTVAINSSAGSQTGTMCFSGPGGSYGAKFSHLGSCMAAPGGSLGLTLNCIFGTTTGLLFGGIPLGAPSSIDCAAWSATWNFSSGNNPAGIHSACGVDSITVTGPPPDTTGCSVARIAVTGCDGHPIGDVPITIRHDGCGNVISSGTTATLGCEQGAVALQIPAPGKYTIVATMNGVTVTIPGVNLNALPVPSVTISPIVVQVNDCSVPLAGATVDITPMNGVMLSQTSFTTDSDGKVCFPYKVNAGVTYFQQYGFSVSSDRWQVASGTAINSIFQNTVPPGTVTTGQNLGGFGFYSRSPASGYRCACGCKAPVCDTLDFTATGLGSASLAWRSDCSPAFPGVAGWKGTLTAGGGGSCGCPATTVNLDVYWGQPGGCGFITFGGLPASTFSTDVCNDFSGGAHSGHWTCPGESSTLSQLTIDGGLVRCDPLDIMWNRVNKIYCNTSPFFHVPCGCNGTGINTDSPSGCYSGASFFTGNIMWGTGSTTITFTLTDTC